MSRLAKPTLLLLVFCLVPVFASADTLVIGSMHYCGTSTYAITGPAYCQIYALPTPGFTSVTFGVSNDTGSGNILTAANFTSGPLNPLGPEIGDPSGPLKIVPQILPGSLAVTNTLEFFPPMSMEVAFTLSTTTFHLLDGRTFLAASTHPDPAFFDKSFALPSGGVPATDDITITGTYLTPVPEPASLALLGSGLAAILSLRRKRQA